MIGEPHLKGLLWAGIQELRTYSTDRGRISLLPISSLKYCDNPELSGVQCIEAALGAPLRSPNCPGPLSCKHVGPSLGVFIISKDDVR